MKTSNSIYLVLLMLLSSCAVGPNFKSPTVSLPQNFSYADSVTKQNDDSCWWVQLGSKTLDSLVAIALDSNKNMLVTLSRVEQARLTAKSAKADMLPSLSLSANAGISGVRKEGNTQKYGVSTVISWEPDVFGKLRRMSEAAKAQFLSTEYGYSAVKISLIADVVTNYISYIEYKALGEIAKETYDSRKKSADIIDSMFKYGMSSGVDLLQAKVQLDDAAVAAAQYKNAAQQSLLALNILLGTPFSIIADDTSVSITSLNIPDVPVGMPSSLLMNRPDIMEAYQLAAAASAQIGVAIANRLPSFSLTREGGLASSIVKGVASGGSLGWGVAATLSEPILNWGNNKRAVESARLGYKQAVLNYEQSVITGIVEVEESLSSIDGYNTQIIKYKDIVSNSENIKQMTDMLYEKGAVDYLNLLDANRVLFESQTTYVQLISSRLNAYVTLIKSLGIK